MSEERATRYYFDEVKQEYAIEIKANSYEDLLPSLKQAERLITKIIEGEKV